MNAPPRSRLHWLLWFAAVSAFAAVALMPLSNLLTRIMGLCLFAIVWLGLMWLTWRWRIARSGLLIVTALGLGFMGLPARERSASLRDDYIAGLQRYYGVPYYWGGESPKGIDCSGLIRRGLIDALFCRGVRTADAGLVREAFKLWWHDCTASALGDGSAQLTVPLFDTPSINETDHSRLMPGDLAVTRDGVHILAYLGNQRWIEADPGVGRVIIVPVPDKKSWWFNTPMKLVRWHLLDAH